ncbi:acyl-CoA dehydrogenase [Streptomyces sp. NPDC005322]|uniref:acyl-CoA dehydrogenase n=1 Tax=unclassified Streptomyces TaxID=2593676 RepID=UPI0033BEBEB1
MPETRALLEDLCRLFLLKQIGEHTGDLLAEGHMAADHVRALPLAIDEVAAGLAPHMMTLVESFDLPADFLARIPIANGDYVDRSLSDLPVSGPAAVRTSFTAAWSRGPHAA